MRDVNSFKENVKKVTKPIIFSIGNLVVLHALNAEVLDLDTTVIEAYRGEISPFEAAYSLKVIEQDDLQRKQVRNLPEALKGAPGVNVQKTSNGQGSPYIRGFTGYRTLALIDGIRYNNSVFRDGPNEYFSLIDSHSLSGLELLLGPSSVQYGSDAVGGSLNLHTKSSHYQEEAEGFFIHGSQSIRFHSSEQSQVSRTEVDIGDGGEWGGVLGYTWKNFGNVRAADIGEQPRTGYDEVAYDLRFDLQLNDQWFFTLAHQDLAQDDVWRTHSTIFGRSFAGTTVGDDLLRLKDQQRSLTYIKLKGEDLDHFVNRASFTLSYQTTDEDGDRVRASGNRTLEYFDSRMAGVDIQLESDTEWGDFVYGFDYYHDSVDSGGTDFLPDGSIGRVNIQGPVGDVAAYDILGVYAQGEFQPLDRWRLTAGARYTYTRADIGRFEDPDTGLASSLEDSWQTVVTSLRAIYDLDTSGEWKAWAGVSQSFRAPNIADLSRYGGSRTDEFEVAATDLDPEQFLTYEIGFKGQTEKLDFSATYYFTDISDYITSTPTGNTVAGLTEVTKLNSASGLVQGIELDASYRINDEWQFFGNMTWLEGELEEGGISDSLSRVLPLTFYTGVRWRHPNGKLGAELNCTVATKADKLSAGDISDTDRIPPGGTPSHVLVNLIGDYQLNDSMEVYLGLDNILDEAYRSHGSGSNEPGFGVSLGFKAHF